AVQFTPPSATCWSCTEPLPDGRVVKFCPFCGADQRHPACPACGEEIERHWKHCPECGTKLGA
ncbi:MAG: zinc-ribbon domain-containing protein, partial [Gemmatimonadales bacterium]